MLRLNETFRVSRDARRYLSRTQRTLAQAVAVGNFGCRVFV